MRLPLRHPSRSASAALCLGASALLMLAVASTVPAQVAPPAAAPLAPSAVVKFTEPLPIPAAINGTQPVEIRMSEFQQRILPAAFYAALPAPYNAGTYVWGYNGSYPGPTIVAQRGVPTRVRYINDLANPAGGPLFLQNQLVTDQTLHWADPLECMMDPACDDKQPYRGPVPAVVHLHGGEVPSAFDGGPDAWFTPNLAEKGPGYVTDEYVYPNEQQAMTMFYHDHALGITRLNVYAGLAGFYLLFDPANEPANLPSGSYEIGLAIQDRMFDLNGQLHFPSVGINPEHPFWLPEFFGDFILVNGKPWPYLNVEPRRYRFRFLNGSNARFYEMRLMDRALKTPGPAFWQIGTDGGLLDQAVKLNDPAVAGSPRLVMAPGERGDIIIDFSAYAGQTLTLMNSAKTPFPKGAAPNPQSTGVIMQFRVGTTVTGGTDTSFDPATTPWLRTEPIERLPALPVKRALTLNEEMGAGGPLAMFVNNTMWDMETTENVGIGDTEVWEVINLTADTHPIHLHLFQYQILNRQAFNLNKYMQVYGMPMAGMGPPLPYDQATAATGFKLGGNPDITPYLQGPVRLPDPNERGWKDTFRMNPGEVTRVVVRAAPQDALAKAAAAGVTFGPGVNLFPFDPAAPMETIDAFSYPGGPGYVWHCHIIDHEDNEMMRRMSVTSPAVPGAQAAPARPEVAAAPPAAVELAPARPNPATGSTTLRFALPAAGAVELEVFDLQGKRVRSLARGTFAAGEHAATWDGRDDGGRLTPGGTYFVRLRAGGAEHVRKLVMVH